jgi:hypothetical protein
MNSWDDPFFRWSVRFYALLCLVTGTLLGWNLHNFLQ